MGYGLACLIVYLIQFVLPTTVAVAQLHFHYVEYSAMCNCASCNVQTQLKFGLSHSLLAIENPKNVENFIASTIPNYASR